MKHKLARRWANGMLVRSNDALRRELIRSEAAEDRLMQSLSRNEDTFTDLTLELADARAAVTELTKANLRLSGLLAERLAPLADAGMVAARVVDFDAAVEAWRPKHRAYLAAETAYKTALADATVHAEGPEYLRRANAEADTADLRAVRDDAETARREAEHRIDLARLTLRAASAGVGEVVEAPEAGDRP